MTVRRPEADRNTHSPKARPGPRRRLLTQRAAVIFSGGAGGGLAAGTLTYLAAHNLPGAVLAGLSASGAAVKFLDWLID
jgi:hypothetical protein